MASCSGWVRSLKDRDVVFTGVLSVGGLRVTHQQCGELVKSIGGSWTQQFSRDTDLVVAGWQGSIDYQGTGASRKLVLASQSNDEGSDRPHVHVIRSFGFSDLLARQPAECVNTPLEGESGDRVRAMTADGQRRRIEGRLELVEDDSGDPARPTVVYRKKRFHVFPRSVHVLERRRPKGVSGTTQVWSRLQDAGAQELIRSVENVWAPRYDITWDEMFGRLETLVEPLKAAGWDQTDIGREVGGWDEDDFVFTSLVRNDISVEIEMGESGWASGWEERLLEERTDDEEERTELTNPRRIPAIGHVEQLTNVRRKYRQEHWLP